MPINRIFNTVLGICAIFSPLLLSPLIAQIELAKENLDSARIEHFGNMATLTINSGRPLASASLALENKYGLQINYEDPPFLDVQDLHDVTDLVSRSPSPNRRVIVPKGGVLDLKFPISAGMPENPADLLRSLLEAHNQKMNPGIFHIIQHGSTYTIAPQGVQNKKNEFVSQKSPLDTRIDLPILEGNLITIIKMITQKVTISSGVNIVIGMVPDNLFSQTSASLGNYSGTARDLLQSAIDSTGRKMAWRLLCDADGCAFNVHQVSVK
jgi:hypothetical protein